MSNKLFNSIKVRRPKSNAFDRSHEKKLSCNMGDLVPILLEEIIPGDKFSVSSEIFMRLAPMLAPVMHRVNVYVHYFFVPNRLVWNEWEDFITGGEDGLALPSAPTVSINTTSSDKHQKGSLSDYFGLPIPPETVTQGAVVSALPFRAYQMIYNEYYRDQNLTPAIDFSIASKPGSTDYEDQTKITTMRQRAWEKDYFTSCLPWAQRGGDVNLPMNASFSPQYSEPTGAKNSDGTVNPPDGALSVTDPETGEPSIVGVPGSSVQIQNLEDPQIVDTTAVTINELRKAIRLQEWLEKNARGGARYIEQIFSHFGVKSSDARLQRPEYLGGGKQPVVISETLQTSATVVDNNDPHPNVPASPQGNMAGHGVSVGKSNRFKKRFEEHGFVIGIMSTLPRTTYQQGAARLWFKQDKFDYFWPEFAHLGEQEVMLKELYTPYELSGNETPGATVFGYQSRYSEYKYAESTVHGDFRDNLRYWHLGRYFDNLPQLNTEFVQANPSNRIFAVEDDTIDHLYVQIYNSVRAIRPMPVFGTPYL